MSNERIVLAGGSGFLGRSLSSVLLANGVKKGDRVSIYMQMIPELAIAMMGCVRIGAVHSIVFGAFSPDALADRCRTP